MGPPHQRTTHGWSAPGFARSTRLIAGGRRCLAGPRTIEREAQLANVDLNEGVLSKGRETLGEPTSSLTAGGFSSHRRIVDKGLRQSRSSRVGIDVGTGFGGRESHWVLSRLRCAPGFARSACSNSGGRGDVAELGWYRRDTTYGCGDDFAVDRRGAACPAGARGTRRRLDAGSGAPCRARIRCAPRSSGTRRRCGRVGDTPPW